MEAYKKETQRVIRRLQARKISFPVCIAALDQALARVIPRLSGQQIASFRALMLANNKTVMREMERRGQHGRVQVNLHR
jgi:hypothetical protein